MDIDESPSKKPASKGDDLSQYNLDDYDDDAKTTGESHASDSINTLTSV